MKIFRLEIAVALWPVTVVLYFLSPAVGIVATWGLVVYVICGIINEVLDG